MLTITLLPTPLRHCRHNKHMMTQLALMSMMMQLALMFNSCSTSYIYHNNHHLENAALKTSSISTDTFTTRLTQLSQIIMRNLTLRKIMIKNIDIYNCHLISIIIIRYLHHKINKYSESIASNTKSPADGIFNQKQFKHNKIKF
jgi:hypothetical protein